MEQRDLADWDAADLERCLLWFFVTPMLSSATPESAGRRLHCLHWMLVFHEGKPHNPVRDVIAGFINHSAEWLSQSIKAVFHFAVFQPLNGPAIPYNEHSGVVKDG
jgi:hypothetical protein